MTKIKDLPRHERPREKLIAKGAMNLKDKELLAILLGTGRVGKNVLDMAQEILAKHPMKKLLASDYVKLSSIKGIGPSKACSLLAAFELTKRALEVEDNNLPLINSAKDAVAQLQELRIAKKEHFVVLYLNARNQLIHRETISVGTVNASLIHPREIFEPAIKNLASQIIVAHNHPSGDLSASEEDLKITKRLAAAGELLGIEVLDHLIIVANNFSSLKESGVL
ncbi:MAG: DNA repair protein RadC [Patescibacteria group bacterium]|nr:DNA repair protein RadC [Patescibacteria group bacterium]